MKTISKTSIVLDEDRQQFELPKGAQPLSCTYGYGETCLWWLVDKDNESESRLVRVFRTDDAYLDIDVTVQRFVDTIQIDGRVWHVFA